MTATATSKEQVTLPAEARRRLGKMTYDENCWIWSMWIDTAGCLLYLARPMSNIRTNVTKSEGITAVASLCRTLPVRMLH